MISLNGLNGIGGVKTSGKKSEPQTSFFQVVVFYSAALVDELELTGDKLFKKLNRLVKDFSSKRFVFPYYSHEVFLTQEEAYNYIPYFIRNLVEKKLIPETVWKEGSLDETVCRAAIVPLELTKLEVTDTD